MWPHGLRSCRIYYGAGAGDPRAESTIGGLQRWYSSKNNGSRSYRSLENLWFHPWHKVERLLVYDYELND